MLARALNRLRRDTRGSTIVEFLLDTPGRYTLVDHALFRAFNKGAVGILEVTGDEHPEILRSTPDA